jgi:hypothetical protein
MRTNKPKLATPIAANPIATATLPPPSTSSCYYSRHDESIFCNMLSLEEKIVGVPEFT